MIIGQVLVVVATMLALDGVDQERGERFGSGWKKFSDIAQQLPDLPHAVWQGSASDAFGAKSNSLRELVEQMADTDRRMEHLLDKHADTVFDARSVLGFFIGLLIICGVVAVQLERQGEFTASLALQLTVSGVALAVCIPVQAVLIDHSVHTASLMGEEISHYHRVSANAGSIGGPTGPTAQSAAVGPANADAVVAGPAVSGGVADRWGVSPLSPQPFGTTPPPAAGVGGAGLPVSPAASVRTAARPGATPQTSTRVVGEQTARPARAADHDNDVDDNDWAAADGAGAGRAPNDPIRTTGDAERTADMNHTGYHPSAETSLKGTERKGN
ncbi:hypothetical protein BST45_19895 [Mycobacterium shinjukuense]|nr:hypothetical protein BST45_19895 [Mycobacterium shinjukuense]